MKPKHAILLFFLLLVTSSGQATDFSQLFSKYSDAVIKISIRLQGIDVSFGSGFFIDKDGYFLTNYHVVKSVFTSGYSISIATKSNETITDISMVSCETTGMDLCLLKANFKPKSFIELSRASKKTVGSEIVIIGHPRGLNWTITDGLISAFRDSKTSSGVAYQEVQLSAPISPGSSGSPILDAEGRFAGVVTSGLFAAKANGLNFGVSADSTIDFYKKASLRKPTEISKFKKEINQSNKEIAKKIFDSEIGPLIHSAGTGAQSESYKQKIKNLELIGTAGVVYKFAVPKLGGLIDCKNVGKMIFCSILNSEIITIEEWPANAQLGEYAGKITEPKPLLITKEMIDGKILSLEKLTDHQRKFLFSKSDPKKCSTIKSKTAGIYFRCSEYTYNFEYPNVSLFTKWIQTDKTKPVLVISAISTDAFTSLVPFGILDFVEATLMQQKVTPPTIEQQIQQRLLNIFVGMKSFKAEFESYSSDLVAAGADLLVSSEIICGFYKPYVPKLKDAQAYSKSERLNDTFFDEKKTFYNQKTRALLSFIPQDAIVDESRFKVACLSNTNNDSAIAIWTIDEKKSIVQISKD